MALRPYLAMTAAEMQSCTQLPELAAWMACHFSPYGNGLSNIPSRLPDNSMLIVNDRIPPYGHDPQTIAGQLQHLVEKFSVSRVLLDMQRHECALTAHIVQTVVEAIPCPTAVTPAFAAGLSCGVFLTPVLRKPLTQQLALWQGREVWLDAAPDCETIVVTEEGSHISPGTVPDTPQIVHTDNTLFCQYAITLEKSCARFTVWRDREQLHALLQEAEKAGVSCVVGLYQQLKEHTDTPEEASVHV